MAAVEIRKLAERIDEAELSRCKAQLKASLFMARESPLARAEQSAGQTLLFDHLFLTHEIAAAVDAVEAADIRRFAERLLGQGRLASAVLGPKSALNAGPAFQKALFG